MRRLMILLIALALCAPIPASAATCRDNGSCLFHLSNSWTATKASAAFTLGRPTDTPLAGDWNGDGIDSVGIRRGTYLAFSNTTDGRIATSLRIRRDSDTILVAETDGVPGDNLVVRRGNAYMMTSGMSTRITSTIHYGKAGDEVFVGDWDGDGIDTFAVRRGNAFYLTNSLASGNAEKVIRYGKAGDEVLVGDWDGDGIDTFTVRRGNRWYMSNKIASGNADRELSYGKAGDTAIIGDWDGNGTDTPGVFRGSTPSPKPAPQPTNGGLTSTSQPWAGMGTFRVANLNTTPVRSANRIVRVRIETENGLNVNTDAFARAALTILNDRRGWGRYGEATFVATTGPHDVRLRLTSPATVDRLCYPLDTRGYTSCRVGTNVVINVNRWALGAAPFMNAGGSITEYRNYVINHEMGHFLGRGHVGCPGAGRLAPVMQQQTLHMSGCRPNGWPHP